MTEFCSKCLNFQPGSPDQSFCQLEGAVSKGYRTPPKGCPILPPKSETKTAAQLITGIRLPPLVLYNPNEHSGSANEANPTYVGESLYDIPQDVFDDIVTLRVGFEDKNGKIPPIRRNSREYKRRKKEIQERHGLTPATFRYYSDKIVRIKHTQRSKKKD